MMITFLTIVWAGLLWGFVLGAVCVAVFTAVHFAVEGIQAVFPDFMASERDKEERQHHTNERQERKLIALDFIIQERLKRQNAVRRRQAARLAGPRRTFTASPLAINIPDEVSISEIGPTVRNLEALKIARESDEQALYTLVRIVGGKKRFLCRKNSRRVNGEITNTHIFAALPHEAIRLDRGAAIRLMSVVPDASLEPANAYARMIERTYAVSPEAEPDQQRPVHKELFQ